MISLGLVLPGAVVVAFYCSSSRVRRTSHLSSTPRSGGRKPERVQWIKEPRESSHYIRKSKMVGRLFCMQHGSSSSGKGNTTQQVHTHHAEESRVHAGWAVPAFLWMYVVYGLFSFFPPSTFGCTWLVTHHGGARLIIFATSYIIGVINNKTRQQFAKTPGLAKMDDRAIHVLRHVVWWV